MSDAPNGPQAGSGRLGRACSATTAVRLNAAKYKTKAEWRQALDAARAADNAAAFARGLQPLKPMFTKSPNAKRSGAHESQQSHDENQS